MSEHRQGPVRSEAARVAILEATARIFISRGYDNLTMEGVATEAGVAKQTIYRWWKSKGDLISDCLLSGLLLLDTLAPVNTGNLRDDLIAWFDTVLRLVVEPSGEGIIRSLITAAAENVEVGRRLRESLGAEFTLTEMIQSAIDRGELSRTIKPDDIAELLAGSLILRALSRAPFEAGLSARLVDSLLR